MRTDELKERLKLLKTSQIKMLAELSGVGLRTLWKIRSGEIKTTGEGIKDKLSASFRKLPRGSKK